MDFSVKRFQWVQTPSAWQAAQTWSARQQAATADFESSQAAAIDGFAAATQNLATGLATIAAQIASKRLKALQSQVLTLNKLV
jgi:hypothetical protein